MNTRMRWIMLTAAFLIPIAAVAQQRTAPVKPAVETTRPAPPAAAVDPSSDDDLEFAELMALAFDDEPFAEADDGEGGGEGGEMRIVDRRVHRMAGPHGGLRMHGMGGGPMGHMRGGPGMRARWSELDLTDAQRSKLRDLHEAHARKAVQRRADMQLARLDLHKLMREDRPNQAAVNAQIDKLARLNAEGMKARFETHLQSRALLTPEQVKRLHSGPGPGLMHHDMGDHDEAPKR